MSCTLDPLQCSRAAGHTLSHSALPSHHTLLCLHSEHYTVQITHCTMHTTHCTVHALNCKLHGAHCCLSTHCPTCTLQTGHCTIYIARHTAQGTLLSAHSALPALHCTARGWVHFWWDDSNGLVVHSAEGQKRPQAAGCTMGRAITHCTRCTYCTLHTLHTAHKTPAHYTLSALHTEHCKQRNTKCSFGHTRVCCKLQPLGLSINNT